MLCAEETLVVGIVEMFDAAISPRLTHGDNVEGPFHSPRWAISIPPPAAVLSDSILHDQAFVKAPEYRLGFLGAGDVGSRFYSSSSD